MRGIIPANNRPALVAFLRDIAEKDAENKLWRNEFVSGQVKAQVRAKHTIEILEKINTQTKVWDLNRDRYQWLEDSTKPAASKGLHVIVGQYYDQARRLKGMFPVLLSAWGNYELACVLECEKPFGESCNLGPAEKKPESKPRARKDPSELTEAQRKAREERELFKAISKAFSF